MTQLSIVDLFYSASGARTDSSNPRFVPVADVTSTYVPFGTDRLNDLALVTRSVPWTGSGASSSGNVTDDKIIAEFAAYLFDSHLDVVHVDPDTGQPLNKHWDQALTLINSKYGVMVNNRVVAPLHARSMKATSKIARVDATAASADSGVPDL